MARGNRGHLVVKGAEQQSFFQELGLFAMALETLPKFKDICDGTLPKPVHEGVRVYKASAQPPETFSPSNMSNLAFFTHANVFHHGRQPVPIELSIASIPDDGKDPEVICLTVDHSNLLTTAKDSRANRYINEWLSLKSHLPGSVPLKYLSFCVRGKFFTWPKETEASSSSRARTREKFLKSWDFLPLTWKCSPISGI
ncbi:uncharacterized protein TNCV_4980021 [Trichonephila clavipes]|nr:uncharacterized protein TNCV_4980021 [Trichonephila clavipes]